MLLSITKVLLHKVSSMCFEVQKLYKVLHSYHLMIAIYTYNAQCCMPFSPRHYSLMVARIATKIFGAVIHDHNINIIIRCRAICI